jgi:hypothetical protein
MAAWPVSLDFDEILDIRPEVMEPLLPQRT